MNFNFLTVLYRLYRPTSSLNHLAFVLIPFMFYFPNLIGLFFVLFVAALGFFSIFGINQFVDRDVDKFEKTKRKGNPFLSSKLKDGHAIFYILGIAFLSIVFSLYFFGTFATVFLVLMIIFGFLYSMPPFRFKSKFILDILGHGLFAVFATIFVFYAFSIDVQYLFLSLLITFIASTYFELANEIDDYKSDKKAGFRTTVIGIGLKKSRILFLLSLMSFYLLIIFSTFQISRDVAFVFLIISALHMVLLYNKLRNNDKITFTSREINFPLNVFFAWLIIRIIFAI